MTPDRRQLIAEALGHRPTTIVEIDVGYDFEVAIADGDWVFRFPRRAGVEEALEVEVVLLPALAPALPVAVPSFQHISREPTALQIDAVLRAATKISWAMGYAGRIPADNRS